MRLVLEELQALSLGEEVKLLMALIFVASAQFQLIAQAANERMYFLSSNTDEDENSLRIVYNSDEVKQAARSLCKEKNQLWIWPDVGPIACSKVVSETGTAGSVVLKLTSGVKRTRVTSVVSNQPFPVQNWSLRSPTSAEQDAAESLSQLKAADRKVLKKTGNVKVLVVAQNEREFLILPFRRMKTEVEGETSDVLRFKIFLKEGGRWKGMYESDNAPQFFGDLDGDGVPEIKRTPYCDGTCEYYDSFYPRNKLVLGWNVHE